MKKLNKNNKGFSLVELLVVIAIMVVLVGVLAPTLLGNIEKSREAKDYQSLDTIAGSLQTCLMDEKVYDEVFPTNADFSANLLDVYKNTGNKYTQLKAALEDALAKSAVYDASEKISLFGGKLAKTAIADNGTIKIQISSSTGKITVSLNDKDGNAVVGKTVTYTVTR